MKTRRKNDFEIFVVNKSRTCFVLCHHVWRIISWLIGKHFLWSIPHFDCQSNCVMSIFGELWRIYFPFNSINFRLTFEGGTQKMIFRALAHGRFLFPWIASFNHEQRDFFQTWIWWNEQNIYIVPWPLRCFTFDFRAFFFSSFIPFCCHFLYTSVSF